MQTHRLVRADVVLDDCVVAVEGVELSFQIVSLDLGRYAPSDATWGGVRLDEIALHVVRERILVADHEADLFAGALRELVGGWWGPEGRAEEAVRRALHTAAADDIVLGLPDGLDSTVAAQGRNLSGGQRQRVRLDRAL